MSFMEIIQMPNFKTNFPEAVTFVEPNTQKCFS